MSGIAGIFYRDGRPVEQETIDKMVGATKHRGPDGIHTWREGSVAMGHCMLHTTPESLHDNLPMESRDGNLVLTADVRLDNREDLIKTLRLKPYREAPLTDCDLIMASYRKWGKDCPKHLFGPFAFAIWDKRERHLFCARDKFGVKPLYYSYIKGKIFCFASEAKSFVNLKTFTRDINNVKVIDFLESFSEDEESTFFKNAYRLPRSNTAIIDNNRLDKVKYCELGVPDIIRNQADDWYNERFRKHFDSAVTECLRLSKRAGYMLSGGLDSSSIVVTAALSSPGLFRTSETFSATFQDVPESDELFYIKSVIDNVKPIKNNILDGISYKLFDIVNLGIGSHDLGTPILAYNSNINNMIYKNASERNIKVILDGFDGDTTVSHGRGIVKEFVMKGKIISAFLYERGIRANSSFQAVSGVLQSVYKNILVNRMRSIRGGSRVESTIGRWIGGDASEVRSLVRPDVKENEDWTSHRRRLMAKYNGRPLTEQDVHERLLRRGVMVGALETLDRISAHYGIEIRYPFWDSRLIEFCLSLPPEQKINPQGYTRLVLRRAMSNRLPSDVAWRRDKANIGYAFVESFRKSAASFLSKDKVDLGYLGNFVDQEVVDTKIQQFRKDMNNQRLAMELWKVIALKKWFNIVSGHSPQRVT